MKSPITSSPLLTRAEVAEILGTCPHTVMRLTKRGLLPALKFNCRMLRYTRESVNALIQQSSTAETPEQFQRTLKKS